MTTQGISIIAAAARPENWEPVYESIGVNDIPFELIFVGPNEPDFDLPDNFRFIKSNTKPAQCAEIASRAAIYPLLLTLGDDIRFKTDHPLDSIYETYVRADDELVMVSCRYQPGGEARTETDHRFFEGDLDSPILPFCTLISTQQWRNIGGIDSQFIAVCWDMDIVMRMYSMGGSVVFSDVQVVEDTAWSRGSNLMNDHRSTDRVLVDQMWSDDRKVHSNRSLPVKSFLDEGILLRSQGPPGRWHHDSELMNKFITSRTYYWLRRMRSNVTGRMHRFRFTSIPMYIRRLLKRGSS